MSQADPFDFRGEPHRQQRAGGKGLLLMLVIFGVVLIGLMTAGTYFAREMWVARSKSKDTQPEKLASSSPASKSTSAASSRNSTSTRTTNRTETPSTSKPIVQVPELPKSPLEFVKVDPVKTVEYLMMTSVKRESDLLPHLRTVTGIKVDWPVVVVDVIDGDIRLGNLSLPNATGSYQIIPASDKGENAYPKYVLDGRFGVRTTSGKVKKGDRLRLIGEIKECAGESLKTPDGWSSPLGVIVIKGDLFDRKD